MLCHDEKSGCHSTPLRVFGRRSGCRAAASESSLSSVFSISNRNLQQFAAKPQDVDRRLEAAATGALRARSGHAVAHSRLAHCVLKETSLTA